MKVATWNVNGIRARAQEVLDWVGREKPDVLCLQEVKASREHIPAAVCDLEGYFCYWHGHKGYSGVALHLRKDWFPASPVFTHPAFDHENRIVAARAGEYLFASTYVPNGGKDFDAKLRFLQALEAFVAAERAQGTRVVLCGDLNVALEERDVHPALRKPEQIGQTPHERELLAKVIRQGLVDVHRKFRPDDDRLFTWWAPWRNMRERNMGWRLDYVLASEPLAAKAVSCESQRQFGSSDHAVVQAVFDVPPPTPGEHPDDGGRGTPQKGQLTLGL